MTIPRPDKDELFDSIRSRDQAIKGLAQLLSSDNYHHFSYRGDISKALEAQRQNPDKEFYMYAHGEIVHYGIEK